MKEFKEWEKEMKQWLKAIVNWQKENPEDDYRDYLNDFEVMDAGPGSNPPSPPPPPPGTGS